MMHAALAKAGTGCLQTKQCRAIGYSASKINKAHRIGGHLELARLLVLGEVGLRFEGGVGGEPDVLEVLLRDGVLPERQPRHRAVVPHLLPLLFAASCA